jgi:large subunit ribosomal protein L7A
MVVGLRQSLKALKNDMVARAFMAEDAQPGVLKEFQNICREKGLEVIRFDTMKELGRYCGIDIGASAACQLKQDET